ncbi:MAG: SDR family oxidoreductase [Minisyncoccia bacterium]
MITGAGGMVGSYVDFGIRTDHRLLDVTDPKEALAVCRQYSPKFIIHLAAETDFDRCERDIVRAYMVNGVGAYNMACAARAVGAKMVYVSTSAVFDGTKALPYEESDVPYPQSHYGHSKYLGELAVAELVEDHIIARISWVFGGGEAKDQKFVAKIIKQLDKPVIKVIAGKRGSPTYGKDLVAGFKRLMTDGKCGIFHMSNEGAPTRADVAREIVRSTGSLAHVEEVDPSFFSFAYADRLDNESMTSRISYMRPWQEALGEYIKTEWSDSIRA